MPFQGAKSNTSCAVLETWARCIVCMPGLMQHCIQKLNCAFVIQSHSHWVKPAEQTSDCNAASMQILRTCTEVTIAWMVAIIDNVSTYFQHQASAHATKCICCLFEALHLHSILFCSLCELGIGAVLSALALHSFYLLSASSRVFFWPGLPAE